MQYKVEKDLQTLLEQGQIEKRFSYSENFFISPMVIKVKKYTTFILAFDPKMMK